MAKQAMIPTDLSNTRALVVVFAMHGCGACDDYLPKFMERIEAWQAAGVPFHVWSPGDQLEPGQIPVLLYDASAQDDDLQGFADKLSVKVTPTTYVMTRWNTTKAEGSIDADKLDGLLRSAYRANL